jgi:hypothetical protein
MQRWRAARLWIHLRVGRHPKQQRRKVTVMNPQPVTTRPERYVVRARRPFAEGGEDCTVILIRNADGWTLYPHGAASLAVALTNEQAAILAHGILGTTRDAPRSDR